MMDYDSKNDITAHISRVAFWLRWMADTLEWRAKHHDESKLEPPEKSMFDEYTPKLKEMTFGSDEYKAALAGMGEALKKHYKINPHHPEHFVNGINGMAIWDVAEMIADWMAAASIKTGKMDLDYLQKRFDISPQLLNIIANTLWAADMDTINNRIPLECQQINNFI